MSESTIQRNRRGSARLPAKSSAKAGCCASTLDIGPEVALKLLDVSETGVRLLVRRPVQTGEQVSLELEGPALGRPVKCRGTVIWAIESNEGQYCVGIRLERAYRDVHLLANQK